MTKMGSSFGYESGHILKGRVSIGDRYFCYEECFSFYEGCSENFLYLFFSLLFQVHCSYIVIANLVFILLYILRLLLHSFTYLFMCCFFSLFMHMLLINCMQSFIFLFYTKMP